MISWRTSITCVIVLVSLSHSLKAPEPKQRTPVYFPVNVEEFESYGIRVAAPSSRSRGATPPTTTPKPTTTTMRLPIAQESHVAPKQAESREVIPIEILQDLSAGNYNEEDERQLTYNAPTLDLSVNSSNSDQERYGLFFISDDESFSGSEEHFERVPYNSLYIPPTNRDFRERENVYAALDSNNEYRSSSLGGYNDIAVDEYGIDSRASVDRNRYYNVEEDSPRNPTYYSPHRAELSYDPPVNEESGEEYLPYIPSELSNEYIVPSLSRSTTAFDRSFLSTTERSYTRPTSRRSTTTQRPYTRPTTTQRPYTRPTTTQRPYTRPTITQRPYSRSTTTQKPYTRPTTTQKPYSRRTTLERTYERPTTTQRSYTRTTTQRPYTRQTTTQRPYTRPTTTQRPYKEPTTTQRVYRKPSTTQRPYTRPTTTQEPYTRPTTTQRPYTRPTTTQRPYTRSTTTLKPYTRPTTPRRSYIIPSTTLKPYVRSTTRARPYTSIPRLVTSRRYVQPSTTTAKPDQRTKYVPQRIKNAYSAPSSKAKPQFVYKQSPSVEVPQALYFEVNRGNKAPIRKTISKRPLNDYGSKNLTVKAVSKLKSSARPITVFSSRSSSSYKNPSEQSAEKSESRSAARYQGSRAGSKYQAPVYTTNDKTFRAPSENSEFIKAGNNIYVPEEYDASSIPGVAGQDYPVNAVVPDTSFSCKSQEHPGLYADTDTDCQAFHICQKTGQHDSFLCPNGTVFNQQFFVCDWWYNFACDHARSFFGLNEFIYELGDEKSYDK